jgi:hypothetical protein
MALIDCPHCTKRVSSLAKVCPHCKQPIAEISEEEVEKLALQRWKEQTYRALNISYLGMALAVAGAIWWWVSGDPGWSWPVSRPAISLASLGAVVYVAGRIRVWWLRFNKPKPEVGRRR